MRKGMAEIQQDPNNSPNDITKKVFENWGKAGITALGEQFKVEGEQAQIRDTLAQAKGREMANERMKKLLDSMEGGGGGGASAGSFVDNIIASSGVAATPQLRAAATTAYTTAILTNKDPSAAVEHVLGTAQRGVGVRQSQEEHPLKMQELAGGAAAAPYKAPQAAATVQKTQQEARAAAPVDLTPEQIRDAFPSMSAEQAQAMALAAKQKGGAGLSQAVTQQQAAETRREAPRMTPEAEQKVAADATTHATSALRFINEFAKGGAEKLGFFKGANATAYLQRIGLPFGDPQVVDMWNSASQQVASTATQGGGFFAQGRVKLAHDVTAGITETPLHALLATDQVADRMINSLEGRISGMVDSRTGRELANTAPLRNALAEWQKVKAVTGTLDAYVTKDGKSVVMFNGNEVNYKNFSKTFDGGKTFKTDAGEIVGSEVIANARKVGVTPEQWLAAAHGFVKGTQ